LLGSRFLQHFLVVVHLYLSTGREAHRMVRPAIWQTDP
jgi:hypothetical protein